MCKHYDINCQILAECCQKFFDCRLCHNELEMHEINRFEIKTVKCNGCNQVQIKSKICKNCNEKFANFYCDKCNLWCEVPIFHCDECKICYKYPENERIHCNDCNLCFLSNKHKCPKKLEKNIDEMNKEECSVCLEKLYYNIFAPIFLDCGHSIHDKCFKNMIEKGNFQCPLCKKSALEIDWQVLDDLISKNPFDKQIEISVFCNDCLQNSKTLFHPYGNKCMNCNSYNTNQS